MKFNPAAEMGYAVSKPGQEHNKARNLCSHTGPRA